jgi:hypothetical protein
MPLSYTVDITNGVGPTAITNAATVIAQLTCSAGKPIRLKRIELQSNQTGSTQAIIPVSLGTYATATSTGGVTPTAKPVDAGNTVAAATTVRALTATLGTTFTQLDEWQWNGANPFDMVFGLSETQYEFAVSTKVALIIPAASGTPSLTGKITFEEFG